MVRKLLHFCWFWITISVTNAQDIITRTDGIIIRANVLDVQSNLVRFKLFQQPDTLVYQISTQDVQAVKMADGTNRNFTETTGTKIIREGFNYETSFGRHILWLYPFDIFYPNFTMAYERILTSGKVGFKFPFTLGLAGNSSNNYYHDFRRNNRFGVGFEVNFYPFGQGRLQYYFGPAINIRSFRVYYFDNAGTRTDPKVENAKLVSLAFKNGIIYQFSKSINISADVGLGVRFFGYPDNTANNYYIDQRSRGYFPGNVHLGFRF